MHALRWWIVVLAVAVVASGCSRKEKPAADRTPDAKAVKTSAANAADRRVVPTSLQKTSPQASQTATAAAAPLADDTAGASTGSPFNLFAPPKVDLPVIRQSETRENNEPVRLIGFVNVDTMQALLAFDGKIRGMEVGESYKDVEVVAIDPPHVTLQRGKERWITALFDQPIVNAHASSGGGRSGPRVTIGQSQDNSRPGAGNWPAELGNVFGGPNIGGGNTGNSGPQAAPLPPIPGLPSGSGNNAAAGQIPLPPVPPLPGVTTQSAQ